MPHAGASSAAARKRFTTSAAPSGPALRSACSASPSSRRPRSPGADSPARSAPGRNRATSHALRTNAASPDLPLAPKASLGHPIALFSNLCTGGGWRRWRRALLSLDAFGGATACLPRARHPSLVRVEQRGGLRHRQRRPRGRGLAELVELCLHLGRAASRHPQLDRAVARAAQRLPGFREERLRLLVDLSAIQLAPFGCQPGRGGAPRDAQSEQRLRLAELGERADRRLRPPHPHHLLASLPYPPARGHPA